MTPLNMADTQRSKRDTRDDNGVQLFMVWFLPTLGLHIFSYGVLEG